MVGRLVLRHLYGGFLDGKMTAWLNRETENLSFGWSTGCVRKLVTSCGCRKWMTPEPESLAF